MSYSKDFRFEVIGRKLFAGESVSSIEAKYGVPRQTIYRWCKAFIEAVETYKTTMEADIAEFMNVRCPRRTNKKLRFLAIDSLCQKHSVKKMCDYLGVSVSGYYRWRKAGIMDNKVDLTILSRIFELWAARPTLGGRQIQMQLYRKHRISICLKTVFRYMKLLHIKSQRHEHAPNILNRDFAPGGEERWVADTTEIKCVDGRIYLSVVKSLLDKSVIAFSISENHDMELILNTLKEAVRSPRHKKGIIFHTDNRNFFLTSVFEKAVRKYGFIHSLNDTVYDNACMEAFYSIVKNEELKLHRKLTKDRARSILTAFIRYYNGSRPQWGLGKMTPEEYSKVV